MSFLTNHLAGGTVGVRFVLVAIALSASLTEYHAIRQYLAGADAKFCHGTQPPEKGLENDCLRLGVVWPAVNLALALGACVNLLLFPMSQAAAADAGRPVQSPGRMANASLSFHDNRRRMATAALAIALVAAANGLVFIAAMAQSSEAEHQRMYWQSNTFFWITASLVLVRDLINHTRACRLGGPQRIHGSSVFHWSVAAGALAQLGLSALLEVYYALFTGFHVSEPVGSTTHSRFVLLSGVLSFAAALLPLNAHRRGFYLSLGRPQKGVDMQGDDTQIFAAGLGVESVEYHTSLTRMQPNQMPVVVSPEASSSLLGQLTFGWVTPVLRLATQYTINGADLYHLGALDRPLYTWRRFTQCRKPKQSLIRALAVTFAPQIVVQAVLAFVSVLFAYAGPFFLQRILLSIRLHGEGDSNGRSSAQRMIYLDAMGMLLASILHSLSTNRVLWIGRKISLRLHGLLVAELSSKALRRRSKSSLTVKADDKDAKEKSDESDATASSDGRMVNMLTSDLESVGYMSSYLNEFYTLPIGFFVGSWYLYSLLGVPALIGLTLSAIYYPLTRLMMKYHIKYQKRLMALDDERVTMITEMFQGIRAVKLFGWQARFIAKVRAKREEEISAYWRLLLFQLPVLFVRSLTTSLILVAILAIYSLGFGNTLTADIVFPSMTVFSMVSSTFNSIPSLFRWMSGCYVSLKRIESFMTQAQIQDLEDRVDLEDCNGLALGFNNASFVWDAGASKKQSGEAEVAEDQSGHSSLSPTRTATTAATTPRKASASSLTNMGQQKEENRLSQLSEQTPLLIANNSPSASYDAISSGASSVDGAQTSGGNTGFALTDISLRFPVGGMSIIVGPTGCGKSSLMAALIGEMTLTSGRIVLPTADPLLTSSAPSAGEPNSQGAASTADQRKYAHVAELAGQGLMMRDIAYVSQEAWLRNATIRENILFGEIYDRDRYEEVLRVCALKPDLRILVAGDMTEIGERGVTLSGGQKQRVSLARAVYSSRRILLIDDCLSAVDAHTGKHILSSCLLGKTKLIEGRTRVLVTHHVAACIPHCDFVAVLKDGRVAVSGSPENVRRSGYLAANQCESGSSDEQALNSNQSPSNVNDSKPEDDYNAARLSESSEQRAGGGGSNTPSAAGVGGTLVEDEECEQGYVRPEIWLQFMRNCGPWWFWVIVITFILTTRFAAIGRDYWVRLWMSSALAIGDGAPPPLEGSAHRGVATWLGVYVAAGIGITVIRLGAIVNENAGSMRAARKYHEELITRVVNATPRFFDKTPIGRVISRFSRDMRAIDDEIISYITALISQITQVGSIFVIISMVTPPFIAIAVAVSVAYVMVAVYYLNATRELKRMDSISMSPLLSLFSELITGVESIRAFGAQSQYTLEAMGRVDAHNRPYYLMWAANRWLCTRIEFSGSIVSFSTIVLLLTSLDRIDAGLAGFVLMYAISFSDYMLWFIRNYSECEISMNAVERINQYLVLEQEAAAFADAENRPPPSWPATGAVAVSDLVVEYVPGTPVLHGISFTVAHGEKIGVVGRTGAGKSSLSLAFLRFIEATSGSIVVDGIDISRIGLEELRRNVTIIPQDPSLFNGTIRFNLDPFDEFPEELLWDALKRSNLVYDPLEQQQDPADAALSVPLQNEAPIVSRMSGIFTSLDAEIKENGQNLSLGQRQLVALARALARRSKLIIMDEATASVDFDTDDRIQRTIRGPEFAASTLFCIAHRLRTIIDYDRVLVLDKGEIVEFDTPGNLLLKDNGVFKAMCEKTGEYGYLAAIAQSKQNKSNLH